MDAICTLCPGSQKQVITEIEGWVSPPIRATRTEPPPTPFQVHTPSPARVPVEASLGENTLRPRVQGQRPWDGHHTLSSLILRCGVESSRVSARSQLSPLSSSKSETQGQLSGCGGAIRSHFGLLFTWLAGQKFIADLLLLVTIPDTIPS